MDERQRDVERRRQRRLEQMGTNQPFDITSSCQKWYVLEEHHVAGRHFDKHTEFISADSHRELTEMQKRRPKATSKTPGKTECAGHYCVGLADILVPVIRIAREYGHKLVEDADRRASMEGESSVTLTREVGRFLIQLADVLERVESRLRDHGNGLIYEAQKASHRAGNG